MTRNGIESQLVSSHAGSSRAFRSGGSDQDMNLYPFSSLLRSALCQSVFGTDRLSLHGNRRIGGS